MQRHHIEPLETLLWSHQLVYVLQQTLIHLRSFAQHVWISGLQTAFPLKVIVQKQPAHAVAMQGVTEANYRAFMGACTCLADLADMSVEQLTPLAGSALFAKKLHDFLHAPCPVADA